jgi:hypothetical protein
MFLRNIGSYKNHAAAHLRSSLNLFTLNMETVCSSETSVPTRTTLRHISEDILLNFSTCLKVITIPSDKEELRMLRYSWI